MEKDRGRGGISSLLKRCRLLGTRKLDPAALCLLKPGGLGQKRGDRVISSPAGTCGSGESPEVKDEPRSMEELGMIRFGKKNFISR